MKVLVLGGTGLLGRYMVDLLAARGQEVVSASLSSETSALDVTDLGQLAECLEHQAPEVVVNCVALTSIDACEADPGLAYRVNARPVAALAAAAREQKFKLVHISTDHFFSGDGAIRHGEQAPVTLVNEYARTKFAAEQFAALAPGALIVRTAFAGKSKTRRTGFAEWLHDALKAGEEITLFEDAYSSLLSCGDLADAVWRLTERDATGVINVASRDAFSKADFIRKFAERMTLELKGKSGSVAAQAVPRADSLALDVTRAEELLGTPLPTLDDTLDRLVADFSD